MKKNSSKPGVGLPEIGPAAFEAEARRQSRLVAASPHEVEDQAIIDSLNRSIWQGIADAEAGRTGPAEAVFDRLEAKYRRKADRAR